MKYQPGDRIVVNRNCSFSRLRGLHGEVVPYTPSFGNSVRVSFDSIEASYTLYQKSIDRESPLYQLARCAKEEEDA